MKGGRESGRMEGVERRRKERNEKRNKIIGMLAAHLAIPALTGISHLP